MCDKGVEVGSWQLGVAPDYLKTRETCERAVVKYPATLEFVPDWFVSQQQLKLWHDKDGYCNNNELIKWHAGYQKRKAQKAKIKEELMPIAWHPSHWWDWCVPEDEKKETEKLWI